MNALYVKQGSRYRVAEPHEVMEGAAKYLVAEHVGEPITTIQDGVFVARHLAAGRDYESVGAILLNTRHRLLAAEVLFTGTIDGAAVYPREVVKRALQRGAAAVILFHNHPSGDPSPSDADRAITSKLQKALALVDVRLLDHLIVTNEQHVSLAEAGWL